ncbi:Major royal jelly protein 1 [Cyphomyrmex costatus]|uniref:Major royal jelly protein 1 n=1 Tax=Cyphomyrmex costatus TaxID=456900 RepID=A0A195CPT2_9HYME|nr:Major royal jelly protein 1 [Cyphomyrmex costatus]
MGNLFALLILSMVIVSFGDKLNVVHKWKYCEFEWENQQQKEDAINSGTYNPSRCLFLGTTKAEDGRIFVTTAKVGGPGSPASLSIVTNETGPGGPLLRPYPDWSWHNNNSMCNGIINVYKLHIQCNHIFVMDNGQSRETEQICDPKLLVFDLKNDMLVKTIYIPPNIANNKTGFGLLIDPLVYVPNKECTRFLDEMIVFVADSIGFGLVVYDSSTERMCRVESDYMKPTDANFVIDDQNVTYVRGINSGPGTPVSLTIVTNETGSGGPLLRPYPDWSWYNNNSMCNGIINVYKLHIECNHIFVMDNGQSRETEQICDPKLLIFDLKNDMLVKTIYIPPHIANNKTGFGLLMDPLVYVPNKECTRFLDEMIVFVADTVGFGLVVYDSSTERMCRVESDYMKPTDANFVINDQNVTYVRGIFSLTIISNGKYLIFNIMNIILIVKLNLIADIKIFNVYVKLLPTLFSFVNSFFCSILIYIYTIEIHITLCCK